MDFALLPWLIFGVMVLAMLILDLRGHHVTMREALLWSVLWISVAMLFNLGIYFFQGKEPALNFLTGYLLEKSLSVDNLFVFLLIFKYFHVPDASMRKVLFWGILGALIMRAIFIAGGLALVNTFSWMLYVFGTFLIYTGIHLGISKEQEVHPENNVLIKLVQKFFPVHPDYSSDHFFIKKEHAIYVTPLFLALISIETSDVIFALDSIPAIFAITLDPFIVFTSNIFAILGLRALFFLLRGLMEMFHHLHYGLAAILVFIGVKMMTEHYYPIPITYALLVIVLFLTLSIVASIWDPKKPSVS